MTDADGIGRPDWTPSGLGVSQATLSDNAELAVRLGSIVKYDRSAKTMFLEEWRVLDAGWKQLHDDTNYGLRVVKRYSNGNGSCLYGQLPVGTGNYFYVAKDIPFWVGKLASIEVSFAANTPPSLIEIKFTKFYYGGSNHFYMRLNTTGTELYIYDNSAGWVLLGTYPAAQFNVISQNILRLTVNMEDNYYYNAQYNNDTYDVSAYKTSVSANQQRQHWTIALLVYGNASNVLNFYCDHVLVSEDI